MKIDSKKDFGRRECPSCAVMVDANNNNCPICQYEFPHEHPKKKAGIFVVGIILLIALIFAFVI